MLQSDSLRSDFIIFKKKSQKKKKIFFDYFESILADLRNFLFVTE